MEESYVNKPTPRRIPREFLWRRAQSLAGLFLVLYLIEHLLTNSQAALFIGDDGSGFVRAVNFIKSLPYLQVIEITLIGFPILLHGGLGITYLFSARYNSRTSDGSKPSLSDLPRNHAYTWQRLTAMILVLGLFGHVLTMRFLNEPELVGKQYVVSLTTDDGLKSLAQRLNVTLIENGQTVLAESDSPGTAFLLLVRETFKSPLLCSLYTIFVLAACFHASNGLWTFCITWGLTLNESSRLMMRRVSNALMVLLAFFGGASIWLTYWINLRG